MQLKAVIQGLAVVWLLLFLVSFLALQLTATDDSLAGGLNRVVAFLTWQGLALVVAAIGAFAARYALGRGIANVKLIGFGPLAVSVFLVGSFIAIMAYRFFVAPLLSGA
jgi:uncharacterized membrane protein